MQNKIGGEGVQYDWLIVGAGLYGCVFAHEMAEAGKKCLVIDRRAHLAGNAHETDIEGIRVHCYGPHIFHTDDAEVWQYVSRFVRFNDYVHMPVAVNGAETYNLPFNMNTFRQLWGVRTPEQARRIIDEQAAPYRDQPADDLEKQALALVGTDVYERLIRHYTEKQWGRPCRELPAFIIRRLPMRFTYDNRYFSDPYQGIPVEGYDVLCERLLEKCDVRLATDYVDLVAKQRDIAAHTLYTGAIDAFFAYCLGPLEYRTVHFENEVIQSDNWQGCAVVNDTSAEVPYTRCIEHKHFQAGQAQGVTVITREYPQEWTMGLEPYYPVNDAANQALYARYEALAKTRPDVRFGGRLGSYRYYDMDKTIRAALDAAKEELA